MSFLVSCFIWSEYAFTADITIEAVYTLNVYTVSLPENPIGYQVKAETDKVAHGESFRFTVEAAEGYDADALVVTANGNELAAVDGVYTLEGVDNDIAIEVSGIADITAPQVTVTVENNTWREFLNTITFGLFFNKTQNVTIDATDTGSGINEVLYHITDRQLTPSELETVSWTAYTDTFHLDGDGQYVIYTKVTDNAGNSACICTDGLVIDTATPQINGIKDGGVYYGNVTFTVTDDSIDRITVNGEAVGGKEITLKPAKGTQEIVITDKAGNRVVLTVTVNEVVPTEPQPGQPDGGPTTGDNNILWLCTVLMLLAMASCCWLVLNNRKKETA